MLTPTHLRLRRITSTMSWGWVVLMVFAVPGMASAAVPWHPDLSQAKAASQISRRPVLILFTATWSEASSAADKSFLATDEAVALLTACYEPVRIDVDADPETHRRLGISHLPSVCVVDADERLLARFDCPPTPAGFVAAAGRAAQDAAFAAAGLAAAQSPSPALPSPPASDPRSKPDAGSSTTTPAAADSPLPSAPTLPTTPPQWAAETVTTPMGAAEPASTSVAPPTAIAAPATTPQAALEPAPAPAAPAAGTGGLSAALPNWLNPRVTPAPQATTPPTDQASPPAAKKPNAFWATVQKPFSGLVRKTVPATVPDPPSQMPSTDAPVPNADPQAPMPVGLEGYCAVTLHEQKQWVEGRAKWGVRHRGRTYLFAGPAEQKSFLADPDRYAPGLSGDDPVVAIDGSRQVAGQRQYGVTYQDKVYLFSSAESRSAFTANPQKYTTRVQVAEQSGSSTVR
ncbi:MAG: YHS domain-containing protein [Planctomycetota bacterium]|nr:MAG: YHS domain-containing protein [Planctomycetota bacterium]